jgi:hypothetical protein
MLKMVSIGFHAPEHVNGNVPHFGGCNVISCSMTSFSSSEVCGVFSYTSPFNETQKYKSQGDKSTAATAKRTARLLSCALLCTTIAYSNVFW